MHPAHGEEVRGKEKWREGALSVVNVICTSICDPTQHATLGILFMGSGGKNGPSASLNEDVMMTKTESMLSKRCDLNTVRKADSLKEPTRLVYKPVKSNYLPLRLHGRHPPHSRPEICPNKGVATN